MKLSDSELQLTKLYKSCMLCPRCCAVDRTLKKGFCGQGVVPRLAWAGLHKGEEPPVSGEKGSGMLFFEGCSLGCAYCQNYQISLGSSASVSLDIDAAMEIIEDLRRMGAASISFVTAEHFAPFVASVATRLKKNGFGLPFVMNTSGWISTQTIDLLLPCIDIWLWDTKTHDREVASRFCGTERYGEEEKKSFRYLCGHMRETDLENGGRGIIVRHLVFPGNAAASAEVIGDFAPYKDKCWFSLMRQFVEPCGDTLPKLDEKEYALLERLVFDLGIENGFVQESDECESEWVPDFTRDNPFPESFATPSSVFLEMKGAMNN